MGLRIAIQKKLIETFKAGTFTAVKYDPTGLPEAGDRLTPTVTCNETSATIMARASGGVSDKGMGYTFAGWAFEVICEFDQEIDYSDFVLNELQDIIFADDASQSLVSAIVGNSIVVSHPPRQGAHTGTVLKFIFNIKNRR